MTDYLDITELPSLIGWYNRGIEINASHLIVAFDIDEPFQPYYAMPDEDYRDLEGRLQGGGHIFETYNLSNPLSKTQLDHFYKWAK